MKKLQIKILTILTFFSLNARSQVNKTYSSSNYVSNVWVADQGDGTYKNPILFADYSDPDVIRVGNDFFMTASSFNCVPGLPILYSKDLVNWRLINHALQKQIPESVFDTPQHGKGVWAPSMNYQKGEFYIYYPDPDYGIYMIKTKNLATAWSKPVLVLPGKGIIDPSSFWDEDGKTYLVVGWAASRAGVNSLLTMYQMDSTGKEVIDEGRHVYDGHDLDPTVEGPKMFKRSNYYYLLPPAGGVSNGWQLALRSKNIYGPYERKVVMDQGSTAINGPHQGSLVQTQTGECWFLHFQDRGAYGRVVHMQPVVWKNNWPVIGIDKDGDGKGEPVLTYKKPNLIKVAIETPVEDEEFTSDKIGLQWQWHANPKIQWSSLLPGQGFLRLFAIASPPDAVNLWPVANLLMQKFPAPDFTVTTKLTGKFENENADKKKGGLLIMGNDYSYLSISKNDSGYYVSQSICINASNGSEEKILAEMPIGSSTVYLRVRVTSPDATCNFSYSEDGINFKSIGEPLKAQPDKWSGAKVGLFCTSQPDQKVGGYIDVDWFRITKE